MPARRLLGPRRSAGPAAADRLARRSRRALARRLARTTRAAAGGPALRHALALGLLQGPTELLPVSSSAHMTLMPMVMGWPQDGLDPRLRKAFEVAVHAGAGLALAVDLRAEIAEEALHLDRRRLAVMALSLGPPALAGLALHGPIERRLGGPRSIAAGLIAGSIAMAAGERLNGSRSRGRTDARPLDGLALGAAQAAALLPGVSRSGATLAAARMRGFTRADSQTLCWHAALPVILGAGSLTGFRLAREGAPPGARAALGAGAAAAFWSTLASARLLRGRVSGPLLLAAGAYRCLLALFLIRRARAGAK